MAWITRNLLKSFYFNSVHGSTFQLRPQPLDLQSYLGLALKTYVSSLPLICMVVSLKFLEMIGLPFSKFSKKQLYSQKHAQLEALSPVKKDNENVTLCPESLNSC